MTLRSLGPLASPDGSGRSRCPARSGRCRRFTSRKHLPSRLALLRQLDGGSAVRVRGQGAEFDSLREYVVGDDVRSIDWRATARRETVVVRTDLARDADLFVCEATLEHGDADGEPRGHLSADEALAAYAASGAQRLLLTHRPSELAPPDGVLLAYDGMELEVEPAR